MPPAHAVGAATAMIDADMLLFRYLNVTTRLSPQPLPDPFVYPFLPAVTRHRLSRRGRDDPLARISAGTSAAPLSQNRLFTSMVAPYVLRIQLWFRVDLFPVCLGQHIASTRYVVPRRRSDVALGVGIPSRVDKPTNGAVSGQTRDAIARSPPRVMSGFPPGRASRRDQGVYPPAFHF